MSANLMSQTYVVDTVVGEISRPSAVRNPSPRQAASSWVFDGRIKSLNLKSPGNP